MKVSPLLNKKEEVKKSLFHIHVGARAIPNSHFGSGVGPIFMDRLSCEGNEAVILECRSILGHHTCSHVDDASVECIGIIPTSCGCTYL